MSDDLMFLIILIIGSIMGYIEIRLSDKIESLAEKLVEDNNHE